MRVIVIGPGALGLWIAGKAALAGLEVTLAARAATAKKIAGKPLRLDHYQEPTQNPQLEVVTVNDGAIDADVVVIATKSAAATQAWRQWRSLVPETATVIGIQNGLISQELATEIGARFVACTVAYPASLQGPGHAVRTGPGDYIIGKYTAADERLDAVNDIHLSNAKAALGPSAPVKISSNIAGIQWTKLLVNSAISGLACLYGEPLGRITKHRKVRQEFLTIFAEGYHAGKAAGIDFCNVGGFRPGLFAGGPRGPGAPVRHLMITILGRKFAGQTSSSFQSLKRGEPTEVPYLNGAIVATAKQHGLESPLNQRVVELVLEMESGNHLPGSHWYTVDLLDSKLRG